MNTETFIRISAGVGVAITLYVLLPVLDLLEISFYLMMGVVWAAVVVDLCLLSLGLIGSMGQGIVAWSQETLRSAKDRTSRMKDDLAARVKDFQDNSPPHPVV